jgi:hypothetical protein
LKEMSRECRTRLAPHQPREPWPKQPNEDQYGAEYHERAIHMLVPQCMLS